MGVLIEDIRFTNEFKATTTDYLLGNIGDKVTIEIDFRAEEVFVTGAEEDVDRILLGPQPFRANVADTSDVIYCEDIDALTNFKVGDRLRWFNGTTTSGEREIYEVIDEQSIRVYPVGGSPGDDDFTTGGTVYDTSLAANSYIYLTTDLTSIIYRYNFVENNGASNYNSLIDNQVNRLNSSAAVNNADTVTQVPLNFSVPTTNDIGSAYVKGNGSTTTAQKFTIVHETFITPWFLAEDFNDFKNGLAPEYLRAASSLKFVTNIDVGRNDNDPNFIETVDFFADNGNVGWFEENFNGGATNYFVDSITYKRLDTSVISSVELTTDEQIVEIVVKNTTDSPFDATTPFSFNFSIIPDDVDDYTNNNKTVRGNFYFDRGFSLVDGATVAGENLGETYQIIKDVNATLKAADEILITATLQLSTEAVTDLSGRTGLEYFVWVSTQDGALDTEDADKVSLIADIEPFFIDLTDDGLITFDTKALRHYETDPTTEGTTTPIARTEDDVLMYSTFYIDRNGRENDEILITSVDIDVIAEKTDGSVFTLDRPFSQSFSGTQVVNDTQFIDQSASRPFKMPDADQRKTINIRRRIDLDTADFRYYEVYYPFLLRWEYWSALADVNGDFFDTAEPNNGQNNQWERYDTVDWDVKYRIRVNLTKNGTALTYEDKVTFETFNYEEGTDWINENIEGFNADTLASVGTLIIDPIKIVATKEYSGASVPATTDDVEWVMRIEVYEQGGITDIRFFSSVYDWTENSWFKSVDTSNKLVKGKSGNIFTAEALLDVSLLPDNSQFKISARIYDEAALIPIPPNTKLTEAGTTKFKEDDDFKIKD